MHPQLSSVSVKPAFKAPELPDLPPADGPRDRPMAEELLELQLARERTRNADLMRENKFILRMLRDRDGQLAALQTEFAAMRRDWVWRTIGMARIEIRRLRRHLAPWRPDLPESRASILPPTRAAQ
jgi:hypothetical protein